MLRGLDIRDILIIDRLELTFHPGLNVLTGETGAGKSILLDALGFVLGWRGRAELVRQGAAQGEVTAIFDPPTGHPARAVLAEAGFPDDGELILRRVNMPDGRKTAWINDRRAGGELLRALSDTLVELHGQHDDRGLLNARGHRRLLDDFGGLASEVEAVRFAWRRLAAARQAETAATDALAAGKAEEEFLRHADAELDRLAPEVGEEAELDARRRMMQGAERIRADVARAGEALGLQGAEGAMTDALRWLEGAADKVEGVLEETVAALGRALAELAEAQTGVERCLDVLDFDPAALEVLEERLFAIRALSRKHAVLADDLPALAAAIRARLAAVDQGDQALLRAAAEVEAAGRAYDSAAAMLSAGRREAATRLDMSMAEELRPLRMERAVFTTLVEEGEAGPEGRDAVTFTVATNPGAPAGPLDRIASGGELSRFLLALKVSLTRQAGGQTLIFDEIDRGVGGATADAIGRRLHRLAEEGAQVLVVTHSPQVAAYGAQHWRVEKRVEGGVTLSSVTPLGPEARVDEIARMLAGDVVTDAARDAARALLSP
ncbi:DNA repair protein RecN [Haematobacter massiliensis]|uniref:DNA repair protein RecN n=1 Tax=Haematobacter massiliensis TaxID=195105 RepID=A0A086YB27_9RHOB|nr:DNA repair protein RecN [Haematobacter massiliensis]KFI31477.1 DNA recombination protein RecN [Haematobacter massiliensis]OWJ71625.1 DNA repair protein RecN [Haematobacter massiliensis]OWJ88063.1 DNA repair protein RecN [Haematobacter massiliensis]QBJ23555.1 DNA repair protein RecN [Haematobacter massiliensis]